MTLQLVVATTLDFAVLGFLAFSIYIHFLDQSISLAFDNFCFGDFGIWFTDVCLYNLWFTVAWILQLKGMSGVEQQTQMTDAQALGSISATGCPCCFRGSPSPQGSWTSDDKEASQRLVRTIQCPKEFGSSVSADDQSGWIDFRIQFSSMALFCRPASYASDLDRVEPNSDVAVTFKDTAQGQASKRQS